MEREGRDGWRRENTRTSLPGVRFLNKQSSMELAGESVGERRVLGKGRAGIELFSCARLSYASRFVSYTDTYTHTK